VSPDHLAFLANHLWQSTLFAAAVWLITWALRENRAAVRHSLWLAASVKFLVPFSLLAAIGSQFQSSLSAPPRVSVLVGTIGQPFGAWGASLTAIPIGSTSSSVPANSVSAVLFYVWILGFVASILWWAVRWLQLRGAVRQATLLNLDVPIRVMACQGRLEPGVFGIFRPVLLLPDSIADRLTPGQLQAVLAHELCHVRRRDNLTAAVHMFVEALFWFHPLVWWIKLRLIDEQERACDEEVLRLGGDPQVYAESILRICECYLAASSMCVSGIASSNLKKRIEAIMRNRVALQLSLSRSLLLAVAAIAALAGPIIVGSARVKAGATESEPAVRAVASPTAIGEVRVITPQTAQLQPPQVESRRIPAAPPQVPRERGNPWSSRVMQEYHLGEIKVTGAKFLHNDVLRSLLGLVPGEAYDETRLRESLEDMRRLYGNLGYVTFLPEPAFDFDDQRKVVNLTLNVDEGRQYTINSIGFTGNTTTPSEVLRREVFVKEGEVFNASLLNLSLLRLNQLGSFEEIKEQDVRVQLSPTEAKLDVNIRVKEKGR
jgi:beta-lactamase regulating signal transducer with metallopeptidase domain